VAAVSDREKIAAISTTGEQALIEIGLRERLGRTKGLGVSA